MRKLHEDIDNLAEVDSGLFWKEINKRRKRSNSEAGCEINFNGNKIRGAQSVTDHWGLYFQELYKPCVNQNFDDSFKNTVNNNVNSYNSDNTYLTNEVFIPVSLDEVEQAVRSAKKGKSCGYDGIFYEHVLYGAN